MEITISINKEALKGFFIGIILTSIIWSPIYYFGAKNSKPESAGKTRVIAAQDPSAANGQAPAPVPSRAEFTISDKDHIRGNFDAPVVLIEFTDFECPYCARHHATMQQIMQTYGDKTAWVIKHFPLSFHPNAQKAAEASECAGDQGKFLEYADLLTENQPNLSNDLFINLAERLKLNLNDFKTCLDSGKYQNKVQSDLAEGSAKGVEGTPATFVNGQLVSGAVPFEMIKSIIDQELQK